MRKSVVFVLAVVTMLCACAPNYSPNLNTTAAPTAIPTSEPTASPVPEKSGYFEIRTTKKIDAFGTVKREVKELVASNKATLAGGGSIPRYTIYFIYDNLGSRYMKKSFFICITDEMFEKLFTTYTDDRSTVDDYLGIPSPHVSGNTVQYKIDDKTYAVTYDRPYVLRNIDFDRIYAALMDGRDVIFSFHSGTSDYVFTVHGTGFSDLVSSIQ